MFIFLLHFLFTNILSVNYRKEMYNLLSEMKNYAINKKSSSSFEFLNNGGLEIFSEDEELNWTEEDVNNISKITNGVLAEGVFYGIDSNYNMKDNYKTPEKISQEFLDIFEIIKKKNIVGLVLDYCSDNSKVEDSYNLSKKNNLISFAAFHRELNLIENGKIFNENTNNINSLKDIKNYLIVLNADNYNEKFISTIKKTNYDLLIIDISLNENYNWTKEEVESLKTKANGGKRIVFAYMSVSEVADYRNYWNQEWNKNQPDWFDKKNENWGSYRVKYWNENWKKILFGNNDAYLDSIINFGYDGVFLDNVDTFVYFEENGETNGCKFYFNIYLLVILILIF